MDKVERTFDKWAQNGRADLMEIEHGKSVLKFLKSIAFDRAFAFLDIGCGNGWVIREMAEMKNCKKAIGIDKSKNMIKEAEKKSESKKARFIHTDIESLNGKERFDFIFSMESLYYVNSIPIALEKIYRLLKPGGQFFCGTDFYAENKTTARWAGIMKIQMHLHSKKQWREFFRDAGFEVRVKHIKDSKNKKKWRREYGTLFITGTK